MSKLWSIKMYESANGEKPVEEFIKSLNEKVQIKLSNTFDHLMEFGPSLGYPHLKKITGTSLWEIRILGTNNIRIFYVTVTEKTFLLLHGFKKKEQKTPRKEIAIAEKRLIEYTSRKINS